MSRLTDRPFSDAPRASPPGHSHAHLGKLREAGEPDRVVESISGHLSPRMLEHYSHIRIELTRARSIGWINPGKRRAGEV